MSSVTMSRSSFDSMDTDDSYSVVDSEEAAPQRRKRRPNVPLPSTCPYRYSGSLTEKHNSCIYSAKFCPFLEDINVFGTVAGRQVTVYECSKKIIPRASYEDENLTEEYYALNWSIVKIKDEDRPVLVFGGKHGIIRAIDPFTGKTHSTILGHGDSVNEISYHPVWPSIIASASKDLTVRIWHVPSQTPIAILGGFQGHQDQILSLDFDYTGKYIVSGSMDHTLRLWNVGGNEQILSRMKSLVSRPDNVRIQPVEMHFPCGASKDLHRNYVDCVRTVKSYIFSKACENCIILSKFGEFNDSSAGGSGVNGFETFSQQVAELELPNSQLWFIRFGITVGPPLSSWIACGNDIGTVHLWDLHSIPISKKSNYQISHRDFPRVIRRVEFSPDGNIMIIVGEGGKISRCDKVTDNSKSRRNKENGIIRDSSSADTD